MTISALEELSHAWDEIRADFDSLSVDAYDQKVLDCAARLAADPGGESAYAWTLGLVLMAPYLAWAIDDTGKPEAGAALRATDGALRDRPCRHDQHPYLDHEEEADLDLPDQLRGLADPDAGWEENHSREEWLCPRNVAGFARIALDIIEPGSAEDIPPRLPTGTRITIDTLAAVLHGYPEPGTDLSYVLSSPALDLSLADPQDRPGHLLTVCAVTGYAASDMFEETSVLDELIAAVEQTLPHYAQAACAHDEHAAPPHWAPDLAELGTVLSSPGGRARYELDHRPARDAPLAHLLCPAFLTSLAEESLSALRARRTQLTHGRTTSASDAP
ncbi:hypothetical protein CG747_03440 [Streptomyces sp. CB02959]|uniref:hypothetical protein n=1 Tax=Streptomyces sp. CB02959 TaxID=2020330 RepID=UPI000C26EDFC|nr:hypothetical protein [Streptomyces sp. CB02959]PJN41736.1 hypothetical protein CG747_03440 [Streptomyces sp. CB02959]